MKPTIYFYTFTASGQAGNQSVTYPSYSPRDTPPASKIPAGTSYVPGSHALANYYEEPAYLEDRSDLLLVYGGAPGGIVEHPAAANGSVTTSIQLQWPEERFLYYGEFVSSGECSRILMVNARLHVVLPNNTTSEVATIVENWLLEPGCKAHRYDFQLRYRPILGGLPSRVVLSITSPAGAEAFRWGFNIRADSLKVV